MNVHKYGWLHYGDIDFDFDSENDILNSIDVCSISRLEQLIHERGKPKYIVDNGADAMLQDVASNVYNVPYLFYDFITDFKTIEDTFTDELPDTEHCFSFMINKKVMHRMLTIKLIEWFKLTQYDYTWSGAGRHIDMTHIINEWDSVGLDDHQMRSFFTVPIEIPAKYHLHPDCPPEHYDMHYDTSEGIIWSYQHAVRPFMMKSAVHLVTESQQQDFAFTANFTEKTIHPLVSLNFFIHVGGYRHPERLKAMGFDIFEDTIDHSYQYMPTLWQRCYWAIKLNLRILSDLDYAKKLRETHYERLLSNRKKVFDNTVKNYIVHKMDSWPSDLADAMKTYWKFK